MNVTNARARFELLANVTPDPNTEPNVSNELAIGLSIATQRYPTANLVYSTRCLIAEGALVAFTPINNGTSQDSAFVAGTAQIETATAAGTITLAGNAQVVVTSAGMTGSPITLNVPVLLNDTAAQWAEKVRTAMADNANIAARLAISGATTSIIATALPSVTLAGTPFYRANDATLNIALDNGTCTGITPAATSANTTAGVITANGKFIGGDNKDVWDDTIVGNRTPVAVLMTVQNGDLITMTHSGDNELFELRRGMTRLFLSDSDILSAFTYTASFLITATTGIADITFSVIATPDVE